MEIKSIIRNTHVNHAPLPRHWRNLELTLVRDYERVVRNGILRGDSLQDITREVRRVTGVSQRHAGTMAKTSVIAVSNNSELETYSDNKDIFKGLEWLSTLDGVTTTECFLETTRVAPLGFVVSAYRRPYQGDIVIIGISSGDHMETTPNHPILTRDGWVKAGELDPRKHVLCSFGVNGMCVLCAKKVSMTPTFGELADSFFNPSVSHVNSKRSSADDFHGDGMVGTYNVDIAGPKRHVWNGFISGGIERAYDSLLSGPNSRIFRAGHSLFLKGLFSSATSFKGCGSFLSDSFIDKLVVNSELFLDSFEFDSLFVKDNSFFYKLALLFGTPRFDFVQTLFYQKTCDSVWADIERLCNNCHGNVVPIEFHNIVSMRREIDFSGHVYNLETKSGLYHAGGVVVKNCRALDGLMWAIPENWERYSDYGGIGHRKKFPGPIAHVNCRSTQVPILKHSSQIPDIPDTTRASVDGQVSATHNYDTWLKTKPVEYQKDVLGEGRWRLWNESKLSLADMTSFDNRPLTLKELRDKIA